MTRYEQLRAQELEINRELERVRHLRRVLAREGASTEILTNLATHLEWLEANLEQSLEELADVGSLSRPPSWL